MCTDVHDKFVCVASIEVRTGDGELRKYFTAMEGRCGACRDREMLSHAFDRYLNTKLGNSFLFPISNSASKNG
jgi:bacterioferritin-associated ferredoxin